MSRCFPFSSITDSLVRARASLEAQARIRVAIWDFENNSERSWWFHKVVIHRRDGKIRGSDSYGNDPHPPKDRKH